MGLFGFSFKKEVEEKERLQEKGSDLVNLSKGSQVSFSVPYFDVFDPRFENFAVPVAVHGILVYAVDDINLFKSINKAQNINDEVFQQKLKGQLTKYVKSVITNAPVDIQIQVLQLERKIIELGELIQKSVAPQIEKMFGINVRSIDLTNIVVDKDSRGFRELKEVTTELETDSLKTRSNLNLDVLKRQQEMTLGGQEEMQRIQLEHQRETMRIQREELQRASRLQTETNFMTAHQADLNGGAVLEQHRPYAQHMPNGVPPMPEVQPQVQYMVGINGQQVGPCNWSQLQQLVHQGLLTEQTYVWKQGMANWEFAGQVQELQPLFMYSTPPMPGI